MGGFCQYLRILLGALVSDIWMVVDKHHFQGYFLPTHATSSQSGNYCTYVEIYALCSFRYDEAIIKETYIILVDYHLRIVFSPGLLVRIS